MGNLLGLQIVVQTTLEYGIGQGITPHVQHGTCLGIGNVIVQQSDFRWLLHSVGHGTHTGITIGNHGILIGASMEGLEDVPLGIGLIK